MSSEGFSPSLSRGLSLHCFFSGVSCLVCILFSRGTLCGSPEFSLHFLSSLLSRFTSALDLVFSTQQNLWFCFYCSYSLFNGNSPDSSANCMIISFVSLLIGLYFYYLLYNTWKLQFLIFCLVCKSLRWDANSIPFCSITEAEFSTFKINLLKFLIYLFI